MQAEYPNVNKGPVKLVSNTIDKMVGSEAADYSLGGAPLSFSELMGLPASQVDTSYWLPWYNNVHMDTQLRFANVSGSPATVRVFIGKKEMSGSPFSWQPEPAAQSFAGVNAGPVQIVSTQNIVAAERAIYRVNGVDTSFSELMALPNKLLNKTYWLPWYNNVGLDTQLRFANVSTSPATVRVFIAGKEMSGSPFTLAARASTRKSFAGIDAGPVKIVSTQNIVAAERLIQKDDNGTHTSFAEMMGLPAGLLDTTYWLPWYNNIDLYSQLRFAVP
jgi:hypothetical protein